MQLRSLEYAFRVFCVATGLMLASLHSTAFAESKAGESTRLQDLLSGEILFHYHQNDYFSAITQLQLAHEKGLLPKTQAHTDVLLARLKLAYGLHEEAGLALNTLLVEDVPAKMRNRAWYELAKMLFHKDNPEAAKQALDNVRGKVPEDVLGDHQLLLAHVLMALHRYSDAAQVLEQWKGPKAMAGYAHYNRGIALVRAGSYKEAIDSLKRVTGMQAEETELSALKDKANLTLGYAYLQLNNLERAQAHLKRVRLEGPFSNRALLAAGWIAQKQGRSQEALVPWMALRDRALADPAVQESLLAVPYVHRELRSPQVAAHHYELAVAALSDELRWLNEAMASVKKEKSLSVLSRETPRSAVAPRQQRGTAADNTDSRYFGRLLASRIFQETSRGHSDLRSMLVNLDKGLDSVNKLADALQAPTRAKKTRSAPQSGSSQSARNPKAPAPDYRSTQPRLSTRSATPPHPKEVREWQNVDRPGRPSREIPMLPELDLPPEHALESLPNPDLTGLPPAPEDIGLPGAPEFMGLPGAPDDIGLPGAPEVIWLPGASAYRSPKQVEDFAYSDAVARYEERTEPSRRLLRRILRSGGDPGATVDGEPVGKAVRELATALERATQRMNRMARKLTAKEIHDQNLKDRIAALRERIKELRERIAAAIALYENYAKSLALVELEERRSQLKHYLEQARLELAKTYDMAASKR